MRANSNVAAMTLGPEKKKSDQHEDHKKSDEQLQYSITSVQYKNGTLANTNLNGYFI